MFGYEAYPTIGVKACCPDKLTTQVLCRNLLGTLLVLGTNLSGSTGKPSCRVSLYCHLPLGLAQNWFGASGFGDEFVGFDWETQLSGFPLLSFALGPCAKLVWRFWFGDEFVGFDWETRLSGFPLLSFALGPSAKRACIFVFSGSF